MSPPPFLQGGNATMGLRERITILRDDVHRSGTYGQRMSNTAVADALTDILDQTAARKLRELNENTVIKGKSETSRLAALAILPRTASQRRRILRHLCWLEDSREMHSASEMRSRTRDQLGAALGMNPNSLRPRVKELIEGGWLIEVARGERSHSGNEALSLSPTLRAMSAYLKGEM